MKALAVKVGMVAAVIGLLSGLTGAAGTWYVVQYRVNDHERRIASNHLAIMEISKQLEILARMDERLKSIHYELERIRNERQ